MKVTVPAGLDRDGLRARAQRRELRRHVGNATPTGRADGYQVFAVEPGDVTFAQGTSTTAPVGGTVPATLSLTLGAPATFGAFTPGVAKDYTASTTADVVSTAGDAALTVSEPGHLTNGAFSLPSPLEVAFSKATLDRAGVTRHGHDRLQAAHRRQRRAAHRRVLEDADLHPVHHDPVSPLRSEPNR